MSREVRAGPAKYLEPFAVDALALASAALMPPVTFVTVLVIAGRWMKRRWELDLIPKAIRAVPLLGRIAIRLLN